MGPYYDIAVQKNREDVREAEQRRAFRPPRQPRSDRGWLARLAVAAVVALAVLG